MDEAEYRRYALVNLPHARTVCSRIQRSLAALGAFGAGTEGPAVPLCDAWAALERELRPYEEDLPVEEALRAADAAAVRARALVEAILEGPARGDRLGQHVRNLFECLGLGEEGALLSLQCGESVDSPLR